MFAIKELSRRPEQRSSGLLLAAIVLGGLRSVSVYGSASYFGVIRIENFSTALLLPGLLVAVCAAQVCGDRNHHMGDRAGRHFCVALGPWPPPW